MNTAIYNFNDEKGEVVVTDKHFDNTFVRDSYEELCHEMSQLLREEKELKAKKTALRKKLIEQSGGDRMEYGIKVELRTQKGSVDYKAMAREIFNGSDDDFESASESFRAGAQNKWYVTNY